MRIERLEQKVENETKNLQSSYHYTSEMLQETADTLKEKGDIFSTKIDLIESLILRPKVTHDMVFQISPPNINIDKYVQYPSNE